MSIYVARDSDGRRARTKYAIGLVEIDGFITEEHELSNELPVHPIETGFSVTDAILRNPTRLVVEGVVSVHSLDPTTVDNTPQRADNAYAQLKAMMSRGDVVTVVSSLEVYENMGIQSITPKRSKNVGEALRFTAVFQEIRKAATAIISEEKIPAVTPTPVALQSVDPQTRRIHAAPTELVADNTLVWGVEDAGLAAEIQSDTGWRYNILQEIPEEVTAEDLEEFELLTDTGRLSETRYPGLSGAGEDLNTELYTNINNERLGAIR